MPGLNNASSAEVPPHAHIATHRERETERGGEERERDKERDRETETEIDRDRETETERCEPMTARKKASYERNH